MDVQPVRLDGPTIRLEPLVPEHAALLWPKIEPELFLHTLEWPRDPSLESFEDWVRLGLEAPGASLYTIFVQATGEAAGMTGYLEIRSRHRGLEIGRTLIARSHQGTRVNPESKYLLLRHAFEDLEAVRVQFKTDVTNLQSQRAIEKLGARREGVLRRFQVRTNGFARDAVVYSIVADEWPEVKAGLEARMAAAGKA
ncbi:MAG TPA: GNAT family protein [Thermoanaerobaculia bacterium]|nr:GNAT family protein [Thermoanaerobaculia bacterium]